MRTGDHPAVSPRCGRDVPRHGCAPLLNQKQLRGHWLPVVVPINLHRKTSTPLRGAALRVTVGDPIQPTVVECFHAVDSIGSLCHPPRTDLGCVSPLHRALFLIRYPISDTASSILLRKTPPGRSTEGRFYGSQDSVEPVMRTGRTPSSISTMWT